MALLYRAPLARKALLLLLFQQLLFLHSDRSIDWQIIGVQLAIFLRAKLVLGLQLQRGGHQPSRHFITVRGLWAGHEHGQSLVGANHA